MFIVTTRNITAVWLARADLLQLVFTGLSNAPIHWKNKMTTTPRIVRQTGKENTGSLPADTRIGIPYSTTPRRDPAKSAFCAKYPECVIRGALESPDQ